MAWDGTFPVWLAEPVSVGNLQNVTDAVETVLGEAGISQVAMTSGTNTTTSATYVSMAGTGSVTSFSFTKHAALTRIRIDMALTFYSNATTSGGRFGVQIDGVDYDICQLRAGLPAATAHLQVAGFRLLPAGIAAGVYTVQGRWLRTEGAGTLTRDTGDWLAISAREINP